MDRTSAFILPLLLLSITWLMGVAYGQQGELQVFYSMEEDVPEGTFLGNIVQDAALRSIYPDVVDSFVYGVLQGTYKVNFKVNSNTGDFTAGEPLDREAICPFQLQCGVSVQVGILEPNQYFTVITVHVDISDNNDITPHFPSEKYVINVSESTQPGVDFVISPALDQDSPSNSIIEYILDPPLDKFELTVIFNQHQSEDLRLKLKESLDREITSSYKTVLKAIDGGIVKNTGSVEIEINVVDHNDNSPVFNKDVVNITVAENYILGNSITKVSAIDLDEGANGEVRYRLSTQSAAQFGDKFEVDQYTGDIILKAELDYETKDFYSLLVEAYDMGVGSLPAFATVLVYVQDVNDHEPVVTVSGLSSSGAVEIKESAQPGYNVARLTVEDSDKGISGVVTCQSLDPDMVLEPMFKNNFRLVTQRTFDYEIEETYQMTVVCKDNGDPQLTSSVDIEITIVDANDNRPIFGGDSYSLSFRENNTVGDIVLMVTASDIDSGKNGAISYDLSEEVKDLFEISDRGFIRAKVSLDHERLDVISFNVIATDGGSPQLSTTAPVTITLVDINDEEPRFKYPSYSFGTYENQDSGTEIGIVEASDADSPPYDNFKYSIVYQGNGRSSFEIDEITGKITNTRNLDRERTSTYELRIAATNTAFPKLSSVVKVTVIVADRNDNYPLILFPSENNHTVQIPGNAKKGYVFTNIQATDADSLKNAELEYKIAGGNNENLFEMDRITGRLSVAKSLSEAKDAEYDIIIVVGDKGEPPNDAVATMRAVINKTLSAPDGSYNNDDGGHDANPFSPLISPSHQKILIILGVVTTLLVIILVTAIVYIKRRQVLHDRDMVQRVYKVDVNRDESDPLDDGVRHEVKLTVDGQQNPPVRKENGQLQDNGRTHLTLEDLKRMKCYYRERPDITQHVPVERPTSPSTAQNLSYNVRQHEAQFEGLMELLQRQRATKPVTPNQDNESTGSNTDSGRGTSEAGHDLSASKLGTEEFKPATRLGNLAPVHLYPKDKNNGSGTSLNSYNNKHAPPSYSDLSQKPTHFTFQPIPGSVPPALPPKQKPMPQQPAPTIQHSPSPSVLSFRPSSPFNESKKPKLKTFAVIQRPASKNSDVSESCDNISVASTTSGEYILQLDNNTVNSVNV